MTDRGFRPVRAAISARDREFPDRAVSTAVRVCRAILRALPSRADVRAVSSARAASTATARGPDSVRSPVSVPRVR